MKKIYFLPLLFLATTVFSQAGFEIKVTVKPFKKQYVYLGHYFGKTYPIIDSVMLNEHSEGLFKGPKKLPGGIYLIGYPNKAGFFEILVDKQQKFSLVADTATIAKGVKFLNSPDNDMFKAYQQKMTSIGMQINGTKQELKNAVSAKDSAALKEKLVVLDKSMKDYREDLISKNPSTLLSALLIAMREPELSGNMKDPHNKADSLAAYYYYKKHYWDGVNFYDGRLAYSPFFEEKIDKYFEQLVSPHQDSVIKELDWMLGTASLNEEMTRFLLIKFVNRYLNQRYMWEDAVFVHLFESYFADKNYSWLTDKGRKTISDRAYSLMSNIMGNPAADISLPDTAGKITTLYNQAAEYTLVIFWDPTCGHCKDLLPKIDSIYKAKWKAGGIRIFAVAKEVDGTKKDWLDFIREKQLLDWQHVYYSKAEEKNRIDNNIPGYSQLYDVLTFPTLYLLDKDKKIIAKKLTYLQMDEAWSARKKGQP
jgi:thiol-disulfide isomerase/thioredoxin